MPRLITGTILTSSWAKDVPWKSGATFTNPVANTVLVSITLPNPGLYIVNFIAFADNLMNLDLQLIDADGTTVLQSQRIVVGVTPVEKINDLLINIAAANQRIRAISPDAFTGVVQCSIY